MKSRRYFLKFVYLTLGTVFLCAFFLFLTALRAQVSSNLAKYRVQIKLQIIPMPDKMKEIASYSFGNINSISCYLGEAYLLAGTALEINDIQGFYEGYFSQQDWDVSVTSDPLAYSFFSATSKQKMSAGRAVEGITIRKCDEECLKNYEFPDKSIKEAAEFKNILVVRTWFVPYEIRGNLCWCCSGG
ncbi:MAG: hypothetical protein HZB18_15815 [Chloroflexi bacterium]|nr:hypothetical protein [Chloroflexota bacterium]